MGVRNAMICLAYRFACALAVVVVVAVAVVQVDYVRFGRLLPLAVAEY